MEYKILEKPELFLGCYANEKPKERQALVSFTYGEAGLAHITVDDHCYILWIWHKGGVYSPTDYIFPAALAVLRRLPDLLDSEFGLLKDKYDALLVENRRLSKELEREEKHRRMVEEREADIWQHMGGFRQWLWRRKQKPTGN